MVGTVVTIGSAPAIPALRHNERIANKRRCPDDGPSARPGVAGIVAHGREVGPRRDKRDASAGGSIVPGVAAAATYALYSWGAGR